jgi:hypothetical protein
VTGQIQIQSEDSLKVRLLNSRSERRDAKKCICIISLRKDCSCVHVDLRYEDRPITAYFDPIARQHCVANCLRVDRVAMRIHQIPGVSSNLANTRRKKTE